MKIIRASFFPIFSFWIIMVAILIAKEYTIHKGRHQGPGYGKLLSGDFPYRDEWMEIYSGERRIGYVSYSVWDSPPDGYEISTHSIVRMPALSGPLSLDSTSIIDSRFKLKELHARIAVPELMDVTVKGEVKNEKLCLEVRTGEEVLHVTMDPRRLLFTDLFTPLYALDIGHVKGKRKLAVYDPLTGGEAEILVEADGKRTIDIAGQHVTCWEFKVTFRTIVCSVFLDKKGRLLFLKGPEGLMVVNELLLGKGAGKEIAALKSAKNGH